MAPKHCFWPTTQWVIRSCLEIIYLIPDLACDSAPLCDRERAFKAANHSVGSRNEIILILSSKHKKGRDLNEEYEKRQ